MSVKKLAVNANGDLFFLTRDVPEGVPKTEWCISLYDGPSREFIEKYGGEYEIKDLRQSLT